MKKFLSFAIAAAFIIAAPSMALAKGKGGKKAAHHAGAYAGKVTAVDATAKTITVAHGKSGASKTFTVTDGTTITVNGAAGKLADITTSMHAKVTEGSTIGSAASIDAGAGKHGKKKKNK